MTPTEGAAGSAGKRLLAVCAVTHPGGAEIGLLRLLGGLRTRGWRALLTTPGPGPLADAAVAAGHEWAELAVGGLQSGAGARAVLAWPRARALSNDHDIVYLNGTVCGRLLPALGAQPAVLHVHDVIDKPPPAHWRRAALVLADSRAAAAPLRGLEPEVVYCPVDPDPPAVSPPWEDSGGPIIGFVGRLEPRKAPLDLVRAAPAIRARRPDARIVVVGDDPFESDPHYLRMLEHEVAAGDGVQRYGWTEDAAGLMRHLTVLVAPSQREPFGTVVAEAMAVGTPVVATAVDGLPEVVQDGVSGRLVAPGDVGALGDAVLDVLERATEMGLAARESARRFHTSAYVERVEELLEDLPASSDGGRRRAAGAVR